MYFKVYHWLTVQTAKVQDLSPEFISNGLSLDGTHIIAYFGLLQCEKEFVVLIVISLKNVLNYFSISISIYCNKQTSFQQLLHIHYPTVCEEYRKSLVFPPDWHDIGFVVRAPINNGIFNSSTDRGTCRRAEIQSRSYKVCMYGWI